MNSIYRKLMIQGTTSDAGKTTLVAALCRIFARKKLSVAPFKPQNMALNSAVVEGGEIGRAQWLQAIAARVEPNVDMNPILIKPASDIGAQIIIHGKALSAMDAQRYHEFKPEALRYVLSSFNRLSTDYENVVIEGAGSPAEINLRDGDIANMGFAEATDCPVILIADIDKGGVFAHIVGTLALLSETEQERIIGFVINKFRGDIKLLENGLHWLEEHTGKPVLGVLPMIKEMRLDAEDAIEQSQALTKQERTKNGDEVLNQSSPKLFRVCVPVIPRISNHTDFDALRYNPMVDLQFVRPGDTPKEADLIILPGSKSVIADLRWLTKNNWKTYLDRHLRYGGKVIGICGGMQMLGAQIIDEEGVDGTKTTEQGFGYLPISTQMRPNKTLRQRVATLLIGEYPVSFSGYEIHHGATQCEQPLNNVAEFEEGGYDGFISQDGAVLGTYLHGIFDSQEACNIILKWACCSTKSAVDLNKEREKSLELLADTVEEHLDFKRLERALDDFWKARLE